MLKRYYKIYWNFAKSWENSKEFLTEMNPFHCQMKPIDGVVAENLWGFLKPLSIIKGSGK